MGLRLSRLAMKVCRKLAASELAVAIIVRVVCMILRKLCMRGSVRGDWRSVS